MAQQKDALFVASNPSILQQLNILKQYLETPVSTLFYTMSATSETQSRKKLVQNISQRLSIYRTGSLHVFGQSSSPFLYASPLFLDVPVVVVRRYGQVRRVAAGNKFCMLHVACRMLHVRGASCTLAAQGK